MYLTVLVPSHRDAVKLKSIERMFSAQRYSDKRLVIIENGSAIGACETAGIKATILKSDHSKWDAMNVGLEWLRKQGGGAWCCWDDDDYYGPEYLGEVSDILPKYDMLGKPSIFVRRGDGRLWFVSRAGEPLGHSFAGWSDCVDFRPVNRWGTDEQFRTDMVSSGARMGYSSKFHFVWQRCSETDTHTWPATDDQLVQMLVHSDKENSRIVDYGIATNYDFVNRLSEPPSGEIVTLPEFNPLDVPGIPKQFLELVSSLEAHGMERI